MARRVAITCDVCRRKLGGDETFNRHRYVAGDRWKCYSDDELKQRGMSRDRFGVWHRGVNPAQGALSLSVGAESNGTPTGKGVGSEHPRTLARTTDPATSHKAAAAVAPRTGTLKRVILEAFIDAGEDGLTAFEAAERVGIEPWQVSKRVSDLRKDGQIIQIGERTGGNGRDRNVYRAEVST